MRPPADKYARKVLMEHPDDPDLSVIVTAHREGLLAHATMRSVWASVRHARRHGIRAEVIVVLDRPDDTTRNYYRLHQPDVCLHEVDFADAGPSRNYGAKVARARYLAYLDGDDLFAEPWLARAYAQAVRTSGPCVFHQLYTVSFGIYRGISRHPSTADPTFRPEVMLEYNPWTPWVLVPRELLARFPYAPCPRGSGFGPEDWHWYCELVAAGIPVQTVDQTVMFYRRRKGSRLEQFNHTHAVIPPSTLFSDDVLRRRVQQAGEARTSAGIQARAPRGSLVKQAVKAVARRCLPLRVRRALRALLHRHPRLPELPDWLLRDWKAVHALEPSTFPDEQFFAEGYYYDVREPHMSQAGAAYLDLCRRLPVHFSHLYLVPWLKTGGAERTTLNYVRALVEHGLTEGAVVMATEDADSPWGKYLPPSVPFLEFGKLYRHLNESQRERLLVRLLLQRAPEVVHNIHSRIAYQVFLKHGQALSGITKLYAHVFCDNLTPQGQFFGYNRSVLPQCVNVLAGVLSDNQTELDRLCELFLFDRARLHTHYQPIEVGPARPPRPRDGRLRVLWAGRLDRQKRPDLLERIARACTHRPFDFHVYGAAVIDPVPPPRGRNLTCHGAYESFSTLPTQDFDVFLYTSEWDGLPNILAEAMAAHLPVIASGVGGVHELVVHGQTGLLVEPFDDVAGYVGALEEVAAGRVDTRALVANAVALLRRRHSWEAFIRTLEETPGYVPEGSRTGTPAHAA
jgi:glycosyltransferase involved in cell wall biosynthesis